MQRGCNMTFKEIITKYIGNLDIDDMDRLTTKINHFVEEVHKIDSRLADKFLMKVDCLVNPHFTRDTAEYAVSKLKNRDGSTGEKWGYEETTRVLNSKGYTFNPADWYYVLNMTYSDKYKQGKSSEDYIEDAYMFLDDIDAPHDKAKRYYLAMSD